MNKAFCRKCNTIMEISINDDTPSISADTDLKHTCQVNNAVSCSNELVLRNESHSLILKCNEMPDENHNLSTVVS